MNDKELLELAAKAAGIDELRWCEHRNQPIHQPYKYIDNDWVVWNPLEDDGDALRLAVKLGMHIVMYESGEVPNHGVTAVQVNQINIGINDNPDADWKGDPYAATRRAIVLAAAEIGRNTG